MKRLFVLPAAVLLVTACAFAVAQESEPLPVIEKRGVAQQLIVDGKPFLTLAGELHNSSASSSDYMKPIWPRLKALNLNTVIGTVSWELMEPEEGHFDFRLVDDQIAAARQQQMRLVLIWFGSWKNTSSGYVPIWVKEDKQRFQWAAQHDPPTPEHPKRGLYALSAFCKNAQDADAKAFRALMHHLRNVDAQHTVVMIQVENEMGILTEGRDDSEGAQAAWNGPVPTALMRYLIAHKAALLPEMATVWGRNGYRTNGTWSEVFGTDRYAQEIFSAWYFGQYVDAIARAGKEELNLPMYVNAWLVQNDRQVPGDYPSGGPVSRMMDIWRAAAPSIDFIAPDIYVADFTGTCESYVRQGNPLFFPESRPIAGNYVWAIGHAGAIGVSPFGVDDLKSDDAVGALYGQLEGLSPTLLAAAQYKGVVAFAPQTAGTAMERLGGFEIQARYLSARIGNVPPARAAGQAAGAAPDVLTTTSSLSAGQTGYAMLIEAAPNEFYVLGRGMVLSFNRPPGETNNWVMYDLEEGTFKDGKWICGRHLNGDEGPSLRRLTLPDHELVLWRVKLYQHVGAGSVG